MKEVDLCIVGLGPAGLGAALKVAEFSGAPRTLCIEGGVAADTRACSILAGEHCRWASPCEIASGVGGAAVMSSGKVSSYPAGKALGDLMLPSRSAKNSLDLALEKFKSFVPVAMDHRTAEDNECAAAIYAAKGFDFRYYPSHRFSHRDVVAGVSRMVEEISLAGLSIKTGTTVTNVRAACDGYELTTKSARERDTIRSRYVLLATGRSGYNLVSSLVDSSVLTAETGHLDVGVRLEFPRELWPDIDVDHNDLKLHFNGGRTFCVCNGGSLSPYRVGRIFVMEGYSDPEKQSSFSNLAITVRINPNEAGAPSFSDIERRLMAASGGWPVAQSLSSYSEGMSTNIAPGRCSIKHWRPGEVGQCFDENTNDRIKRAVLFFASTFFVRSKWNDISVFAPEVDYYWPRIRMSRGFTTGCPNLFMAGDATGHYRGILQAFATGGEVAAQMLEAPK